jgi:hypothetical protein
LTERRPQFACVTAGLVGIAILHLGSLALAQGALTDQSGTLTATPTGEKKTWLQQRFTGSWVNVSAYSGTSTFYSSGYRDPYVSNVVYLKPYFQLGTKYDLSLAARVILEEELTLPDTPNGRRFYPEDTWLSLGAKNLYTAPRAKIKIGGGTKIVLPTSYESLYSHLVFGLGASLGASRPFEFGKPDAQGKRWSLVLTLGSSFTKNFHTSEVRGNFPGDTTGCRETGPAGNVGGPSGVSGNDRCGGPLNTSFSVLSSGGVELARGRYSLSVNLIIINNFRYSVDSSVWATTMLNEVPMGRQDYSWGLITLSRDFNAHLSASAGIASYQPALDSRYQNLRFPFFDFSGANANNFTQLFLGLTGTL